MENNFKYKPIPVINNLYFIQNIVSVINISFLYSKAQSYIIEIVFGGLQDRVG